MKKIFSQETIINVPNRELEELTNKFLNSNHGLTRSMSAIQIALKMDENYEKHSKILLNEINKPIHSLGIRFGIKSSWTIVIALIENLKPEDYPKIKQGFDKWDNEEKERLFDWLKDFPDHLRILKEGHL